MRGLHLIGMTAAFSALLIFAATEADAQRGGGRGGGGRGGGAAARGGGGGGHQVRSSSSGSIGGAANRSGNYNRSANANRNVNRNTNVNRNVNVNRDVDIDVDHDYNGWGGYHPVARATAVATTAAVVRGAYYSTLPAGCATVVRVGLTYYQCGGYWYQPSYSGSNVTYVVVDEP